MAPSGRTMAQPIRSSGWPCRSPAALERPWHSGTRPGNRCAISGRRRADRIGCAPRPRRRRSQLNFAEMSATACAAGAASSSRCGRPAPNRDQAGKAARSPATAARKPLIAPLKTVAKEIRDRSRGQRRRHLGAGGPGGSNSVVAIAPRCAARRWRGPRPNAAIALTPQMNQIAGQRRSMASPDINSAMPAPPDRHDRDRTGREIRLPVSAGRWRKINEIARQRIDRRPIDDRRLFRACAPKPAAS